MGVAFCLSSGTIPLDRSMFLGLHILYYCYVVHKSILWRRLGCQWQAQSLHFRLAVMFWGCWPPLVSLPA